MATHNELGKWGEDCAADYLQRMDYTIVARDWKSGHHDIDIIAIDEETLVFSAIKGTEVPLIDLGSTKYS